MDPLQALVLGVVQGLSEFLPISSSAHLIIVPWLFGWNDPGLTFDVALHAGTLVAVLGYFWRDWLDLLGGFVRTFRAGVGGGDPHTRLFWLIVMASIPGAIVGAVGEDAAETALRNPTIIAILTIGLGIMLVVAERIASRARLIKHLQVADGLVIGLAQALAIFPGVSRAGVTITTGLFRGLTREAAARFSFLMASPIIAGAAIFNLRHLVGDGVPSDERLPFVIGVVAAGLVGWLAIGITLRFVQRHSLLLFAYYRFALGILILLVVVVRSMS